jgi:SAM-dependent methyltransferase
MNWDERYAEYVASPTHREGPDLDRIAEWVPAGSAVLDVATGGGHVARRLREAGSAVVTCDASPGMRPDVVCRAEELPFEDDSFDVVVTRIAAHHFADIGRALAEMARVTRDLLLVEDTLHSTPQVEEAERVRDPSHVRMYTEEEWRRLLDDAGIAVDAVEVFDKSEPLEGWIARTGCAGRDAERVRELLSDSAEDGVFHSRRILLLGRKR